MSLDAFLSPSHPLNTVARYLGGSIKHIPTLLVSLDIAGFCISCIGLHFSPCNVTTSTVLDHNAKLPTPLFAARRMAY